MTKQPTMSGDIASFCRTYVLAPNYVDLTSRQFAMLAILCDEPGPHRIRHLAAAIGVQKPVATRNVTRFVQLGYAASARDETDGRDVIICATEAGKAFRTELKGLACG